MRKLFAGFLLFFCTTYVAAADGSIFVLNVQGVINPIIGEYVRDGIETAKKEGAGALLIELDTPGGLLDTTRDIISGMLNADLPIIVYVAPRGSRATSAGVFLTMASDVAVMAPETHIGAAHHVNIGGDTPSFEKITSSSSKTSSVMGEKMVSDAAAYIRTLAADKGRNVDWAEKAVRESVSLTADEALKQNVINAMATSREDLFQKQDKRIVKKNGKTYVLKLTGVPVREFPMSQIRKWLQMLGHPNVAYILLTIGVYGLIYELATPGIGLGGGVGIICLLLAFFSLQILPINTVGLALIILGLVLLALELLSPSHGLLTFGGLISFALGSFFLIDVKENPFYQRVSLTLILPTVGATALFFGFIIAKALQARRAKPKTGAESLIGARGVVENDLNLQGMVSLHGELWTAEAAEPIDKGTNVIVEKISGNRLFVKKAEGG